MNTAARVLLLFTLIAAAGSNLMAHVTVQPKEVPVKSFQEFMVRVPTEKDQPTTKVKLVFPDGFELLRIRPTAGWKYEIERDASGRITSVTWSGGSLARTEYEVFSFMARSQTPGTFKLEAYQTYGTSDVVAWVNDAEPRPAPQVKVVAAASTTAAPASADPFASSAVSGAGGAPSGSGPASSSTSGSMFGGAALVVSLGALFMSWQASRRSKS